MCAIHEFSFCNQNKKQTGIYYENDLDTTNTKYRKYEK